MQWNTLSRNTSRKSKSIKEQLVQKTKNAVKARLTKEINYWDNRAYELKRQEEAGKQMAGLNAAQAQQNAEELQARLQTRMEELELERRISPMAPFVIGCALVVPQSLLDASSSDTSDPVEISQTDRARIDRLAVDAVMAAERRLGREPKRCPMRIQAMILSPEIQTRISCYSLRLKEKQLGQQLSPSLKHRFLRHSTSRRVSSLLSLK